MTAIKKLGYCGVDCSVCSDYRQEKCPGCRKTDWTEQKYLYAGEMLPEQGCCCLRTVFCFSVRRYGRIL